MHGGSWLKEAVVTFIVTLVVTIIVTFAWNLIVSGDANTDWATSFRLAIILGIALPIVHRSGRKQ
jgi:hypothetical protein